MSFHFPLQKVLDCRHTQLDVEEAKFRQAVAALAAVDRARSEVQAAASAAESEIRRWEAVAGSDLRSLADYRTHVRAEQDRLAARRAECAHSLAAQEAAMLEARRRCRLLERLKERRLGEWKAACDRELDQLAADAYLARWGPSRRARL